MKLARAVSEPRWSTRDAPTVRLMTVIEVRFNRGKGDSEDDPVRVVTHYYDDDTGALLFEVDPSPSPTMKGQQTPRL